VLEKNVMPVVFLYGIKKHVGGRREIVLKRIDSTTLAPRAPKGDKKKEFWNSGASSFAAGMNSKTGKATEDSDGISR